MYIPPKNSHYARDFNLVLSELAEEVLKLGGRAKGEIPLLLLGDFNAHTGQLQGKPPTDERMWLEARRGLFKQR